jgi:predicted aldo/keto reductase-like oxidoreductase
MTFIESERAALAGEFCRGCGYCEPCPAGIEIHTCARMSLLLRRSPTAGHLSEAGQAMMKKIEGCLQKGSPLVLFVLLCLSHADSPFRKSVPVCYNLYLA